MELSFYQNNRKALCRLLPDGDWTAIVSSGERLPRSADEEYDFQVNTNFYYLTGISQPNVCLMLTQKNGTVSETLFIDAYDAMYAKWIGHRLTKEEASALCGVAVENIRYTEEFRSASEAEAEACGVVYLDLEKQESSCFCSFGSRMRTAFSRNASLLVRDLYPHIVSLRAAKKPCEIEALRRAIAVTGEGIFSLMRHAKPGLHEYQLEAYFDHMIKDRGNRIHSFRTIAASGKNATTLHYSSNNTKMQDGDLVLFDLGCREEGYCADISRTFPVNGVFTPQQKTIYNIVLAANRKIIEVARAGMTVRELQNICIDVLTEGCLQAGLIQSPEELKNYYFHSISHSIGLDTHDPLDYKKPLPVGAVISDEPGLYFAELGIGIRIEDDLLLTEDGAINLSAEIPKEIHEIEALMAKT